MVTFADIAEYLYEECQYAESDGKEVYPLYKKEFQKYLLIEHGITDSRTVNSYWKNILLLECHVTTSVTNNGVILDVPSILNVCGRIIARKKKK